jgi:hypothetical protein
MEADSKSPDANFNLRKAAVYRDRAKATPNARLKAELEATTREYELRARGADAAVDPKAGKSSPVRVP